MKKIAFITKNRIFAQSLAMLIEKYTDLEFDVHILHNQQQAILDAQVLSIDVAVLELFSHASEQIELVLGICKGLRESLPSCRLLLIAPQDNDDVRRLAVSSVESNAVDDFVFYDVSLDYLLAKLLSM